MLYVPLHITATVKVKGWQSTASDNGCCLLRLEMRVLLGFNISVLSRSVMSKLGTCGEKAQYM